MEPPQSAVVRSLHRYLHGPSLSPVAVGAVMTTALVVEGSPPGGIDLIGDLAAAGIHVRGAVARGALVREAAQAAPDVVVCYEVSPDDALFETFALLAETAPRPVVLFTHDPDVAKATRAMECGIHGYVVNGYGAHRLRAVVHVARARFDRERRIDAELADVTRRFDERKLVDRAKGILMRARQVSEEEAFAVLRAASMHSNRRVGQVSQQVIAAAGHAEAVNRAGQLRMLSQRLVKLHALRAIAGDDALADSVRHVEANLGWLDKSLSKATYGDVLDAVRTPWLALKAALATPGPPSSLTDVDALAERMLLHADRLVAALEASATMTSLHVINVSGRQRMLSQRVAKEALLAALLRGDQAAHARSNVELARTAFEEAMAYLRAAPLSTPDIVEALQAAGLAWTALLASLGQARAEPGQRALLEASEALLSAFEQLTERYERSMQILMG